MNNKYKINFISEKNFENHVIETLKQYNETLKFINLKIFK